MDTADQICELPTMLKEAGSLSSNPRLWGTALPDEDPGEDSMNTRRGSNDTNNLELPVTTRRGSGEINLLEVPTISRRGSSDSMCSNDSENPVRLRRQGSGGRRGSTFSASDNEEVLMEGKRASWGYCGSHLLRVGSSKRGQKGRSRSQSIIENEETAKETENNGASNSLADNIENKNDTKKDGSPKSLVEELIGNKDEKSTQTFGNSIIEKMKMKMKRTT